MSVIFFTFLGTDQCLVGAPDANYDSGDPNQSRQFLAVPAQIVVPSPKNALHSPKLLYIDGKYEKKSFAWNAKLMVFLLKFLSHSARPMAGALGEVNKRLVPRTGFSVALGLWGALEEEIKGRRGLAGPGYPATQIGCLVLAEPRLIYWHSERPILCANNQATGPNVGSDAYLSKQAFAKDFIPKMHAFSLKIPRSVILVERRSAVTMMNVERNKFLVDKRCQILSLQLLYSCALNSFLLFSLSQKFFIRVIERKADICC